MLARTAIRSTRVVARARTPAVRQVRQTRFQSQTTTNTGANGPNANTHVSSGTSPIVAGLAGGGVVFAAGYAWYVPCPSSFHHFKYSVKAN